ncbi:MAG TPA: polysaccharide deacetylase family protein [Gemmatimonadaceae bacterium]
MSRPAVVAALPALLVLLACREGKPPALRAHPAPALSRAVPGTVTSAAADTTADAPPDTTASSGSRLSMSGRAPDAPRDHDDAAPRPVAPAPGAGGTVAAPAPPAGRGVASTRAPNELGRVPILEYHLLGDRESRWMVERTHFRRQLELLYERGYRPVSVADLVDRKIALPAGQSPVVFTFDDAPPSQFGYIERNGALEVDPNSAVGIWLDFHRTHPDWANKAVFCMLPGAAAGHAFFGDKGIDGQRTEWRQRKVRFLAEQGFELCDHTLWHANLGKYPDAVVQEQIARGVLAIDSAVAGYRVRTFALPLGVWPKNRELARAGEWRDPRSGRVVRYAFDAVLEVAGGPARSPYDPRFDAHRLPRMEVFGNELEKALDALDRSGMRYVSDGNVATVARPGERARLVSR